MTISPARVRLRDATMWAGRADGRTLGVPLAWFPRRRVRLLRIPPATARIGLLKMDG